MAHYFKSSAQARFHLAIAILILELPPIGALALMGGAPDQVWFLFTVVYGLSIVALWIHLRLLPKKPEGLPKTEFLSRALWNDALIVSGLQGRPWVISRKWLLRSTFALMGLAMVIALVWK